MWQLLVLGMLLQPAPAAPAPAAEPEAKPTYDEGEMRVEILAFLEQRYLFFENFLDRLPDSALRVQYRLRGADLAKLVQVGELVIDEAVDDTGKSLVDPQSITESRRESVRDINMKPEDLRNRGWMFGGSLLSAHREAKVIKNIKGSMRCVFASASEEILITNPIAQIGQMIEHPRLAEIGVKIELVDSRNPNAKADEKREIGVRVVEGEQKLRGVEACDAWLRPIVMRRPIPTKDADGVAYQAYQTAATPVTADSTLILIVSPDVNDRRVEMELTDIKLP